MERPSETDCCNSGCNPCIFDVYEAYVKKTQHTTSSYNDDTLNLIRQTSYSAFTLLEREQHTTSTMKLTFKYQTNCNLTAQIHFQPGQYFLIRFKEKFTRAYTPILVGAKDQFTILVKRYENGIVSRYLYDLPVDTVTYWRGPYGDFQLETVIINNGENHVLLCMAQGTGIAPLYTIIKSLVVERTDFNGFIRLLYCCRHIEDVPLRQELYDLLSYWNFTYELYVVGTAAPLRKYNETVHVGRLVENDVGTVLLAQRPVNHVLLCGSTDFMTYFKQYILTKNESLPIHTF